MLRAKARSPASRAREEQRRRSSTSTPAACRVRLATSRWCTSVSAESSPRSVGSAAIHSAVAGACANARRGGSGRTRPPARLREGRRTAWRPRLPSAVRDARTPCRSRCRSRSSRNGRRRAGKGRVGRLSRTPSRAQQRPAEAPWRLQAARRSGRRRDPAASREAPAPHRRFRACGRTPRRREARLRPARSTATASRRAGRYARAALRAAWRSPRPRVVPARA